MFKICFAIVKVIKRGTPPKSSLSVFKNMCKDRISLLKTVTLDRIAIYNSNITKKNIKVYRM